MGGGSSRKRRGDTVNELTNYADAAFGSHRDGFSQTGIFDAAGASVHRASVRHVGAITGAITGTIAGAITGAIAGAIADFRSRRVAAL